MDQQKNTPAASKAAGVFCVDRENELGSPHQSAAQTASPQGEALYYKRSFTVFPLRGRRHHFTTTFSAPSFSVSSSTSALWMRQGAVTSFFVSSK